MERMIELLRKNTLSPTKNNQCEFDIGTLERARESFKNRFSPKK